MLLPFISKKKATNYYLGLLLKENQGVVLIIDPNRPDNNIVDYEKFDYSSGWEHLTEDIDETLFRLESKHKLHLEETIFFIFSHLVDEKTNQIKKPYQQVIKNLVKDLELKPLGFIDCHEAVVRYLEEKEEMKLTGILVELDKNNVTIFIYKGGKPVFSQLVAKTDNLIDDLNSVFINVRGKIVLPARIILYNSRDLNEEVTKIVSHRWPTELFVQLPKVEIVQEKDILTNLVQLFKKQIEKEEKKISQPSSTKTGFIIGEDIKNQEREKVAPVAKRVELREKLNQLKKTFSLSGKFSFLKADWQKKLFLPVGLIIIGLGVFLNEYYLHQVKIEVFVPSAKIEKNMTVLVSESGKGNLLIKPVTKTDEVSVSKAVTGKKEVGEAAKGEVTVYNYSKEREFPQGTKISVKGLTFTFDDEVKVASASLTSDGSAKLPGKAKVSVTASQIGEEGNLDKNQTFKIEDLDPEVYFAKNETSFSGGSKKEITTVSSKDYQALENKVLEKAKELKQTSLKLKPEEKIIKELSKFELIDKNYSHEIGDEAEQLTLTAKVKSTFYSYQRSKLISLLKASLLEEVKPGYSLNEKAISYQINKAEQKKEGNYLKITASTIAIKSVNKEEVAKLLLGANEKDVEGILKKHFSITGYNLDLRQPLPIPFLFKRLPLFPKNFEVKIDSLES